MPEFCVTYAEIVPHPTHRGYYPSKPRTLIVEAVSKVQAYCVAFDHLTRKGQRVGALDRYWAIDRKEFEEARRLGVPESAGIPVND